MQQNQDPDSPTAHSNTLFVMHIELYEENACMYTNHEGKISFRGTLSRLQFCRKHDYFFIFSDLTDVYMCEILLVYLEKYSCNLLTVPTKESISNSSPSLYKNKYNHDFIYTDINWCT